MVSSIRYSTACPSSSSEQEIRGKIKSAMVYPILVLVFAFIMVIVLHRGPAQVQGNIRSMNVDLPTTQALFTMGDILRNYWYIGVIGAIAGYFGLKYYKKTERAWQIDLFS